jgi:hypothetical protein
MSNDLLKYYRTRVLYYIRMYIRTRVPEIHDTKFNTALVLVFCDFKKINKLIKKFPVKAHLRKK